jgi:flagellar motor switch protein FliM
MAPNEAVVAVAIEIRIGESVGLMNIAMPSLMIKMMRQKFDQQWSVRKTEATPEEQARVFGLIQNSMIELDLRLRGATLTAESLLSLKSGDILSFDCPISRGLDCMLNGQMHFRGRPVTTRHKRAVLIEAPALDK